MRDETLDFAPARWPWWEHIVTWVLFLTAATWHHALAVVAVMFLLVSIAVADRLIYWQKRKIETLEARR